jgi:NADP-dependent aldehyde dehydrogenase
MALKNAADKAGTPIYLEMSSLNPVFLLPGALQERNPDIAEELLGALTLGGGQFCTKPGLTFLLEGTATESYIEQLQAGILETDAPTLLTKDAPDRIAATIGKWQKAGARLLAGGQKLRTPRFTFQPTLLRVSADQFEAAPQTLQEEAFGPVGLLVVAKDSAQLERLAAVLEGNLTGSIYSAADGSEDALHDTLAAILRPMVGRLLNDKVPTGVAVVPSMNHGGPHPATGHPGFTAVGFPACLSRFAALRCYDHVRPERLPLELREANPTEKMWRMINKQWTQASAPSRKNPSQFGRKR